MANAKAASELSASTVQDYGEFSRLLAGAVKPPTEEVPVIVSAVHKMAELALADTKLLRGDYTQSIDAMIAEIDRKLSEQMDEVMHHQDFQKMESAWRGLHYLVSNTETDETLKIRFMNVSKKELGSMFRKFQGVAWDQSPLFKNVYESEYGVLGGTPYGCLIGDFQFDHSAPDMEVLSGISKIAASAHAPFITTPSPSLFNMESWQELSNPRDLTAIFEQVPYAQWRSFRKSEDSRYVGMAMPRFLARRPYGAATNPTEGFNYEETAVRGNHDQYTWASSAYAMGTNITRAFKETGWCTTIRGVESGGKVEGLPTHTFETDDGGVDMKCPTEIAITDRREQELAKNGMMALVHSKGSDFAAFIAGDSLHLPPKFDDAGATANARLGARLPYLFAVSRFAHYLKVMVRDRIGSFSTADSLQKWLQNWIGNYVTDDPDASDAVRAERPLSGAQITIVEDPSNPGVYRAEFHLRPHYQLEGLNIGLRLVSELPSQRQG